MFGQPSFSLMLFLFVDKIIIIRSQCFRKHIFFFKVDFFIFIFWQRLQRTLIVKDGCRGQPLNGAG